MIKPLEQFETDGFRRTWLRRHPADVRQAGRRLGADVAEMTREDLHIYPEPADDKCPPCSFLAPCRALQAGHDAQPILQAAYRKRPPEPPEEGRLGGRSWSLGRGATPPKFGRGAAPPKVPRPARDIQGGGRSGDPGRRTQGHEHGPR